VTIAIYIGLIFLGYLLGSIPSAVLVARLWGKKNLRSEGDGHISATAVYRYCGKVAFILVIALDYGKGFLAVFLARTLVDSQLLMVLVAYAAVIGHCWSIFIRFTGGLGGVILISVLSVVAFKETLIGLGVCIIVLLITRKSSLATYTIQLAASAALLIQRESLVIFLFPLGLIVLHFLKRLQTQKNNTDSSYKHELFDDLKRTK
jgi:acyl phosphate:glycerol-3-phosphate acyltransferase